MVKCMAQKFLVLFLLLSLLFTGCSFSNAVQKDSGYDINPLSLIVKFYQGPLNHLSSVRYGKCPMHPSCSNYSAQSFKKHGMVVGWVMTSDRLMRCGRDETKLSPKIFIHGEWKYFDPVSENDFWENKIF